MYAARSTAPTTDARHARRRSARTRATTDHDHLGAGQQQSPIGGQPADAHTATSGTDDWPSGAEPQASSDPIYAHDRHHAASSSCPTATVQHQREQTGDGPAPLASACAAAPGPRGASARVSPCASRSPRWPAADREQVAHDAEVDELEDRRLGVLVDRDDRLRGLHARPGAGSRRRCRWPRTAAATTVLPVWPTWLACGYQPASTAARRGADRRAERVGERLDRAEVAAGAAPAGDHDRRPRSARAGRSSPAASRSVIRAALARVATASRLERLVGRPRPARPRGRAELGLTVMIGVPVVTCGRARCTSRRRPTAWSVAVGRPTSTASVIRPEPVLIGQPGRDLLALGAGRRSAPRPATACLDQRGQRLGLGRDQVVASASASSTT